jgi:hypothetical protein
MSEVNMCDLGLDAAIKVVQRKLVAAMKLGRNAQDNVEYGVATKLASQAHDILTELEGMRQETEE